MKLLQKRLQELMNKEILVIMEDGKGFKGKLVEYDDEYIVLREVIEGSIDELKWRAPMLALPITEKNAGLGGITVGDSGSRLVKLNEVIIRISMILRIWLWTPEKVEEEDFGVRKY